MIWIFIKNFLRSVGTVVVVTVVTFILTMIVSMIWNPVAEFLNSFAEGFLAMDPFAHKMGVLDYMIVSGIIGTICSVIWLWLGTFNDWFYNGKTDCVRHCPHTFFGVIWILILPLAFTCIIIWMSISGYDSMVVLFEKVQNTGKGSIFELLPIILPTVAASQICYAVAITAHYLKWQRCSQCKRMFCINYYFTGSENWSETKYKTKKEKQNLGALYANDIKIADVQGNVSRTYETTLQYQRNDYGGVCNHCGGVGFKSKYL